MFRAAPWKWMTAPFASRRFAMVDAGRKQPANRVPPAAGKCHRPEFHAMPRGRLAEGNVRIIISFPDELVSLGQGGLAETADVCRGAFAAVARLFASLGTAKPALSLQSISHWKRV
jgi:hypothetical protein